MARFEENHPFYIEGSMQSGRNTIDNALLKLLGKIAGFGSVALFLVSILVAFKFFPQSQLKNDQLSRYQTLLANMRTELDEFAEQRIAYESEIASLNKELRANREVAELLKKDIALAQEQISPDPYRSDQQIRAKGLHEIARQQRTNDIPTRAGLLNQLTSLEQEEVSEILSLQSNYGRFLQALDVSEERMEVIVDSLLSQIAANNRARRDIIEENVGNPESSRSIRRELFALDSPAAQREAVSYLLYESELEVFDSFQEERQQQRQMSRTHLPGGSSGRAGNKMFNENIVRRLDRQTEIQIIELESPDDPAPN
ncbi:MAG TPA: hypothetical protein DEF79_03325 [Gammaproteobacteria bacterium]|nr:hypothetical protein [Gammaproteobacteria bacterium]